MTDLTNVMNATNDVTAVAPHARRRFFAPPQAFDFHEKRVTLDAEEAHHLRKVLRLVAGDRAFVFDGEGREYSCTVTGDDDTRRRERSMFLEIETEVQPARPESPLDLTLAVALLKGEKLDLVVQKATELGVTEIATIETKRADVRVRNKEDAARRAVRSVRLRRLALEAAKQSGRARVPIIHDPVDFLSFAVKRNREAAHLMFSERDGRRLQEAFDESGVVRCPVVTLVGAEGGWDDEEIALARENSWQIVTLGGRILRAETAAITVIALLQHLYGDMK